MSGFKCFLDDVPPAELCECLLRMKPGEAVTPAELQKAVERAGFRTTKRFRSNTVMRLKHLGLVTHENPFSLTHLGTLCKKLYGVQPETFYELAHYLHLKQTVTPNSPPSFWTYRLVCEFLCSNPGGAKQSEIAGYVMSRLLEIFPEERPVFDKNSVGKCMRWLRELRPNPLPGKTAQLEWRTSTSSLAFLVAIEYFYESANLDLGFPVLLSDQNRWRLRTIGFLTESALETVVDELVSSGRLRRTIGVSGVSVTLGGPVDVETLEKYGHESL